jgi:hypothetical protein
MNKLIFSLILLFSTVAFAVPSGKGPAGTGGGGGGAGVANLDAISDVDLTGAVDTNVLCRSAGIWVDCSATAPGAHATTHEPGGADQVTDITYAPSDNNNYGGSDPGDMKEALDYLSPRSRMLLSSNRYDMIVDLDTATTYTVATATATTYTGNCARAVQEGFNEYLSTVGSTVTSWSVAVTGSCTIEFADMYDAGAYRYAFGLIPTARTPGTGGTGGYSVDSANADGWPMPETTIVAANMNARTATGGGASTLDDSDGTSLAGLAGQYVEITSGTGSGQKRYISSSTSTQLTVFNAWSVNPNATSVYRVFTLPSRGGGGINMTIDWDANFTVDMTGQSEPAVVYQRANGWMCGYQDSSTTGALCPVSYVSEFGSRKFFITNDVASTGWIAGEMPEASASTITTADRSTIVMMDLGYRRNVDKAVTVIQGSVLSNDNIGWYIADTWGTHRASGNISGMGLGVKFASNTIGTWPSVYAAGNNVGIAFGDVPNGGDFVPSSSCLSGYCTPQYTGGTGGILLDDWIFEGNTYGEFVSVDGGGTFRDIHGESNASPTWHQWIIGAIKCTVNVNTDGIYGAEASDCDSKGGSGGVAVVHSTGPVTQMKFEGGNAPGATSERYRGIIIGNGATQTKGSVAFDSNFVFGGDTIPANNSLCTGPGAPYFFCEAAASSDALIIHGPSFPSGISGGLARVVLANTNRLAFEPGALGGIALWPYNSYWTPNDEFYTFTADNADINANDALGLTGGFVADGALTANTAAVAHIITRGFNFAGNANYTNVYVKHMHCTPGTISDWGAGESITLRPFITNGTTTVGIGNGVTFIQGTDLPGVVKSTDISVNTEFFDSASGSTKAYRPFAIGVYVSSESDAGDDNLLRATCSIEVALLGND